MSDERYLHEDPAELIPGYDYDPTPKTLVEVFGVWLNPVYVIRVWSEVATPMLRPTIVRFTDGSVIHFNEPVEQVVAAINGEMR